MAKYEAFMITFEKKKNVFPTYPNTFSKIKYLKNKINFLPTIPVFCFQQEQNIIFVRP